MNIILRVLRAFPKLFLGKQRMRRPNFVLKYARGKDVLDIGVVQHSTKAYDQPSWLHKHIQREASFALGIDVLGDGIKFLRERGYNVEEADAEAFSLGRTFDVVVAGEIIEHLNNAGHFLDNVSKHLVPGGALVITTPNPWYWGRAWEAWFNDPRENPEHTALYSIRTLSELLRRHGFIVESSQYGSGQDLPFLIPVAPARIRHNSIWMVARKS